MKTKMKIIKVAHLTLTLFNLLGALSYMSIFFIYDFKNEKMETWKMLLIIALILINLMLTAYNFIEYKELEEAKNEM